MAVNILNNNSVLQFPQSSNGSPSAEGGKSSSGNPLLLMFAQDFEEERSCLHIFPFDYKCSPSLLLFDNTVLFLSGRASSTSTGNAQGTRAGLCANIFYSQGPDRAESDPSPLEEQQASINYSWIPPSTLAGQGPS